MWQGSFHFRNSCSHHPAVALWSLQVHDLTPNSGRFIYLHSLSVSDAHVCGVPVHVRLNLIFSCQSVSCWYDYSSRGKGNFSPSPLITLPVLTPSPPVLSCTYSTVRLHHFSQLLSSNPDLSDKSEALQPVDCSLFLGPWCDKPLDCVWIISDYFHWQYWANGKFHWVYYIIPVIKK